MATGLNHVDSHLLTQLRADIQGTMGKYVSPGSPVALLDYPNHSNVGDCAIWLGEVAYLQDASCEIVYRCDLASYNALRLRQSLAPEGTIVLHGGGNFGDLWPQHENFREQVLSEFPDYKVVWMPQTIHFRDPGQLDRARRAIARHQQTAILARDEASWLLARDQFECPVELSPDLALWLKPSGRARLSQDDILWLARTDIEAVASDDAAGVGIRKVDWLNVARDEMGLRKWLMLRGLKRLTGLSRRTAARYHVISGMQQGLFDPVALAHYERGRRLLSRGRVVITDRLHAHLMCLLMGIPHVLLDNSYGKLSRFWETWTSPSQLASWAPDHVAAVRLARGLAAQ